MAVYKTNANKQLVKTAGNSMTFTPNAISIELSADLTIPAVNTRFTPKMTQALKIGDKLNFTNNEIVIGSGVSYVKASAKALYNVASGGLSYVYITKNGNNVTLGQASTNGITEIVTPSVFIPVVEGDKIGIPFYSNKTGTLMGSAYRTYLTVEVVK
jgi:hypothetical protein